MVVEDLDLVIRVYGEKFHTDSTGMFRLIELKFNTVWLGIAQQNTFQLIDAILRKGDPTGKRYDGYYVVNYDNNDFDIATIFINGKQVSREKFISFLSFKGTGIFALTDSWNKPEFQRIVRP